MAGELYTLSGMGRTFQLYCLLGDENQRESTVEGGGEKIEKNIVAAPSAGR